MKKFIAGQFIQRLEYKSFEPSSINHFFHWDDRRMDMLLDQANREIGELNAFSQFIPDVDFFIQMYVRKEANTSSRIEGTQTTLDEDLLPEEEIAFEKRNDWKEVQNYIHALNFSISELKTLPLSLRILRNAHKVLLQGVRGEKKQPGEIRISQNWIGGTNLQNAFFIPPHPDNLGEYLSDLEKFLHNKELQIPHLIKIAIAHYQFETIHPFLDGNGRIGRLMITLYLVSFGLLGKPILYLSDFLARHKAEYYNALTLVRGQQGGLEHWVKFFLSAVIETSQRAKGTMQKIIHLRKEYESKIAIFAQSKQDNAQKLLEALYSAPIVTVKQVMEICQVSFPTANSLVVGLVEMGILREITGKSRNRYFVMQEYFGAFEDFS